MVILASGMARGRVHLAATTTTSFWATTSPKMAAILQKKVDLGRPVTCLILTMLL